MHDSDSTSKPSPGGIHISRGVTMRIPVGGLVIRTNGDAPGMEITRVELQLDTCVHWLEIARENLTAARSAHQALLEAKANGGADLGELLDREFKASVQASVAAATFFEALHAAALERAPTRPTPPDPNRRQRQSRYVHVSEQLRRCFGLQKQGTANLRSVLREIYRFRDEAVHPSTAFGEPVLHPQLQVGVERRFVMFSFASARELVRAALAFSKILASRDLTRRPKAVQEFAAYLLTVCTPLYIEWEQSYGALCDDEASA
jgi:hypothetical protein